MSADKAYEIMNREISASGLEVRTPQTIRDVTKSEIPLWVKSMGGIAVVKVPYSNAGQGKEPTESMVGGFGTLRMLILIMQYLCCFDAIGVYTITNTKELNEFMSINHGYDKFIIQSLIGNSSWSSATRSGQFYHTGTIPNKKKQTFVTDLRMMVSGTASGFQPVSLYARRALLPLAETLTPDSDSWGMLGTNLSVKKSDGSWDSETERLLMMDNKGNYVLCRMVYRMLGRVLICACLCVIVFVLLSIL